MGGDGRVHRQAASIVRRLRIAEERKKGGISVKSLTLAPPIVSKRATHAVTCEVLRYWDVLSEVIRESDLLNERHACDRELMIVLVYELLLGKGLKPVGREEKFVLGRKVPIKSALAKLLVKAKVDRPELLLESSRRASAACGKRYARVNLLKITVQDAIRLLREEGYDVKIDPYLADVVCFPSGTELHEHTMVKDGRIVLQGWSSCLSAHALSPPLHSKVIDACAAPGNKTTHLASLLQGTGEVLAFDKDPARVEILRKNLERSGAKNVSTFHADFLGLNPQSNEFADVTCILLDPSCSGSGTSQTRMENLIPKSKKKSKAQLGCSLDQRIESLAKFQEKALRHALKFPGLQRLVYSTCSIHTRENEQVICNVLKEAESRGFFIGSPLPEWPHRGEDCECKGSGFIRVDSKRDGSDGFFVALLLRESPRPLSSSHNTR